VVAAATPPPGDARGGAGADVTNKQGCSSYPLFAPPIMLVLYNV